MAAPRTRVRACSVTRTRVRVSALRVSAARVCCTCALSSSAIGVIQKCRVLTVFSMTIACACMWCARVYVRAVCGTVVWYGGTPDRRHPARRLLRGHALLYASLYAHLYNRGWAWRLGVWLNSWLRVSVSLSPVSPRCLHLHGVSGSGVVTAIMGVCVCGDDELASRLNVVECACDQSCDQSRVPWAQRTGGR